jgi:ribose transport system permease protein
MILIARLGAAEPIAGSSYELYAIAAAVMGGASLMGGRGSIVGAVLGALVISTLQTGLTILNVQAFWQLVAIGTVVILAVAGDRAERARAAR